MIRRIVLACAVIVGLFGPLTVAEAGGTPCVGYTVTTPPTGTHQGPVCSPVPQPSPFDYRYYVQDCTWVPPAGVTVCASVTVYRP